MFLCYLFERSIHSTFFGSLNRAPFLRNLFQLYYFLCQVFFSIMLFIYWDAKYEICIDSTLPTTQQIVVSLGPTKSRLYEIPSVCLSVCQDFFWNCSFMHKIKVSSNFKSDTARLFEKNLVLGFGGKNGFKMSFFKFYEQLIFNIFLILIQVAVAYELKVDIIVFFWKVLSRSLYTKRGAIWIKNEVFQVLSKVSA